MMVDRVGQQLGNYRLIRLLGQGGFADVYLGEHIYLKTPAAIKLLQTRLAQDDLQVFLKEARAIANLVHPNIVRVLEFGVEKETPFLVMDYASNGTLRHRHPKGSHVPPATIAFYIRQIASSLQYAHDQRLVHRDIKPENMLLGRNNEVLLSDFGIAVVAQSSRYQSSNQEIGGTIAYMAPEQLQGRAVPASDQYALGIVVYEWLCGERPFQGSFPEIASQHMLAAPIPLRTRIPGFPPTLEEVVQRALAKNPQQRFMNIQAFATALEQACQFAPPLTIQPSQPSSFNLGSTLQNPTLSGTYGAAPPTQSTSDLGPTAPRPTASGNFGMVPPVPPSTVQLTPQFGATQTDHISGNYGPPPARQGPLGNYEAFPQNQSGAGFAPMPQPQGAPMFHQTGGQFSQIPQSGKNQSPQRGNPNRLLVLGLIGLVVIIVLASGLSLAAQRFRSQGQTTTTGNTISTNTTPANNNSNPNLVATNTPAATDTPAATASTDTPTPIATNTPISTPISSGLPCSVDIGNWTGGSADWKILNGVMLNDGTGSSRSGEPTIVAPCQPMVADYAIEVKIQVVRDSGYSHQFGIVTRGTSGNGNWQGYSAVISTSDGNAWLYTIGKDTLIKAPFTPGSAVHTYRLEAKGNTLSFSIDGTKLFTTIDNTFLSGSQLGLWSDYVQLQVTGLKVTAL